MRCRALRRHGALSGHSASRGSCNKILTIEASGIGIAYAVAARHFGNVPVKFAKKRSQSILMASSTQHRSTPSPSSEFPVIGKGLLGPKDRVLILDDFLANGKALEGLLEICELAGPRCRVLASRSRRQARAGETAQRPGATVSNRLRAWGSMDAVAGTIEFLPHKMAFLAR